MVPAGERAGSGWAHLFALKMWGEASAEANQSGALKSIASRQRSQASI